MCQLSCVRTSLVWPSNQFVSLDLAPFSEKVENHCFRQATTQESHGPCAVSYFSKFAKSTRPRAVVSRGQWCSVLPFKIYVLPFHIWHPDCCVHPILYFKNVSPLCYVRPPFCEFLPTDLVRLS